MHAPPHDPTQLLKFMLVNGQKSSIERERHGQSFLRFGDTEVGTPCDDTPVPKHRPKTPSQRPSPNPGRIPLHKYISLHPSSMQSPPQQEIREALGVDNRMVGYVFLVDGKGRARWRCVRAFTCVCVCVCMFVRIYVCIYIHMCVYMCMFVRIYVYICVCVYF